LTAVWAKQKKWPLEWKMTDPESASLFLGQLLSLSSASITKAPSQVGGMKMQLNFQEMVANGQCFDAGILQKRTPFRHVRYPLLRTAHGKLSQVIAKICKAIARRQYRIAGSRVGSWTAAKMWIMRFKITNVGPLRQAFSKLALSVAKFEMDTISS